MDQKVRAHVVVSGRVQGVFFRVETQRAIQDTGVTGWVRNRPEGTVEAVFEGPAPEVNQAIDWCHKGSPMALVANVEVRWEDFTGEYDAFNVTH